jgi:hypothetical protein
MPIKLDEKEECAERNALRGMPLGRTGSLDPAPAIKFQASHSTQGNRKASMILHLRKAHPMSQSILRSQAPTTLQMPKRPTPIAFISGPLEVDPAYFDIHYAPRIQQAIREGHRFILGPSRGTDTLAFDFLKKFNVPASRIRVYLNTSEETRLKGGFKRFEQAGGSVVIVKGGHTQRDEAMTRASHYDILRYRTEEECRALYGAAFRKRVSGTEKNELRRKAGVGLKMPPPEENGRLEGDSKV